MTLDLRYRADTLDFRFKILRVRSSRYANSKDLDTLVAGLQCHRDSLVVIHVGEAVCDEYGAVWHVSPIAV